MALAVITFVGYRLWPHAKTPANLANVKQISQWNKPMNDARLSPDGHAIAFDSPVGGVSQVFLMLTSGGEPLQLTNDEEGKLVDGFSADGKEIYYERAVGTDEIWAVPTLGGTPRRVVAGLSVVPSPDGASIFYTKSDKPGIYRSDRSGLSEEFVYRPKDRGMGTRFHHSCVCATRWACRALFHER